MIKKCVICGKEFKSPPCQKVVTCSPECRSERAKRAVLARGGADILHTPEIYKKIKENPNMNERMKKLQAMGVDAMMQMPKFQKGIQNKTSKLWILVDPLGNKHVAINLCQFIRDNAESFGINPDNERSVNNISSGFLVIQKTMLGKNKGRPVYHCREWGLECPSIDFPEEYSNYKVQNILNLWISGLSIKEISEETKSDISFIEDVLEVANFIKKEEENENE